jgi:hypothetical protein
MSFKDSHRFAAQSVDFAVEIGGGAQLCGYIHPGSRLVVLKIRK